MNEKEYILIDDFIWDSFDLPLEESADKDDFYSLDEIKHQVANRIIELQGVGYELKIEQISEYEIRDTKALTAGIKSVANNKYLFVISKYAAQKKNEKYLDTIIYHELCHILVFEYLFASNFIYYVDTKLVAEADAKDYVQSVLKVNGGHTPLWQMFASKINHALLVNPPIAVKLEDKDLADIMLESIYQQNPVEIDDWIQD